LAGLARPNNFTGNLVLITVLHLSNFKVAKPISLKLQLTFAATLMVVINLISSSSLKSFVHELLKALNISSLSAANRKRLVKVR
jgi:hypothetical protein